MFNILLDPPPTEWNGYRIDSDFQIGIQISQCMIDYSLNKTEKMVVAANLLFIEERPNTYKEIFDAINWFLNGWNQDNKKTGKKKNSKKRESESMDFDVDQWRIYAAFKSQYRIDLNVEKMHFWVFMGMLSCLDECAFTKVVEIREKKITSKMSKEEKSYLQTAKDIFRIRKSVEVEESESEKEEREAAIDIFNKMRRKN